MSEQFVLDNPSYLDFFNLWTDAVNKENFELAANLDALFYQEFVRKNESLAMWDKWQKITFDRRKKITNFFKKINPSISHSKNSETKNVAVIYDQFSGLAHETQFARSLKFLKKNSDIKFNLFIVYAFGPENHIAAHNVHDVELNNIFFLKSESTMDVGRNLAEISKFYGFDVIIYGSTFELAFWSSLTCNHINQKYLIMKYYPNICGRFSSFAGGREDNNNSIIKNNFEYLQLSILDLDLNLRNDTSYPEKHRVAKNFGSISRIQKTISPSYQEFVLRILACNDSLNYIYTGNANELDLIDSRILNHKRSNFLGWIDPLYAIDEFSIYVDPFPWGGGEMTLLALANGIPYLTLSTYENKAIGIYRFLKYLLLTQANNHNFDILNTIFCSSISDLEHKLNSLCNSFSDRVELGINWQVVLENYRPHDLKSWQEFLVY